MQSPAAVLRRTAESPGSSYLLHHVQVLEVARLSPSFIRLVMTGPELDRLGGSGYDQRIKLVLPLPDVGLDPVVMDDSWYETWRAQPDERRNPIRTYTIRQGRPERRELVVDVVRHGVTGPAGRWIERVQPGDELIVCVPNAGSVGDAGGSDFQPPAGCSTFLFAGDETAAPAIAAILERLPASSRGVAVLELPDPGDAVVLPAHPGIDVCAFAPVGPRGAALIAAVAELAPGLVAPVRVLNQDLEDVDVDADELWETPDAAGRAAYAWLAGEAGVIKALRRYLVSELGWDRKAVAFMGYWRLGKTEDNG